MHMLEFGTKFQLWTREKHYRWWYNQYGFLFVCLFVLNMQRQMGAAFELGLGSDIEVGNMQDSDWYFKRTQLAVVATSIEHISTVSNSDYATNRQTFKRRWTSSKKKVLPLPAEQVTIQRCNFPNTEMEMELGGAGGTEDKLTIFQFQLVLFVEFLLLNWD